MIAEHATSRGEITLKNILDTAENIFAKKGFAAARVDEIAREAGVNKAAIYYHVGDKAGLYKAVILKTMGNIAEEVVENVEKGSSCKERLEIYLKTIGKYVVSNENFARIMTRELAAGGANLPKEVVDHAAMIIGTLAVVLKEGCRSGGLEEADPYITHFTMLGGYFFYLLTGQMRGKVSELIYQNRQVRIPEISPEEAVGKIAGMIIHSLEEKKPTQGFID